MIKLDHNEYKVDHPLFGYEKSASYQEKVSIIDANAYFMYIENKFVINNQICMI